MSLGFKIFWIITALELALWLFPSLKLRRILAPIIIIFLTVASIVIFYVHISIPTGLILVLSLYRGCNLARLTMANIHERFLKHAVVRASICLIGLQSLVLLLLKLSAGLNVSTYHLWLVFAYASLVGSLIIFLSTNRNLRKTRVHTLTNSAGIADRDLPTLTIAIPARNETEDLDKCLQSLIKSNYPKLEIIVLDDCSQNKHTPEIIRSFAHSGVRFIQGSQPEENWLAKNQSYQRLFEESSGELILFCGVDVRFKPYSLRQVISVMIQKQKSMVSLIPTYALPLSLVYRDSSLLQPIRYAWELAMPRHLLHRPPVTSTCWIIKRENLDTTGGFGAVSRSIVPESYFARSSAVHDGYSFMQSDGTIGLLSNKSFNDQRETTVRIRYPQLHRRMELAALATIFEAIGVMMPYALILLTFFGHLSLQLSIVGLVSGLLLTISYVRVVSLTFRRSLLRSFFLLPVAIIYDIALLNYSMVRYEFFSVVWKGRNVCIPVMRSGASPTA